MLKLQSISKFSKRIGAKKVSSYFPQSSCSVIPMIYPKLN
ncbi:hypothetical protein SGRA_3180 [Saprospira grandis str. Lewin]|uniref:Uncharacterized protein n=1 Tax=Saprospira grandis (strain Lewin) TaxID=984262 RepID=H6L0V2_SAPGL|nr:hypothetical protein SGRA_3180 [Saprospira grandis str. Lewin]